jgi:hypothetical protein
MTATDVQGVVPFTIGFSNSAGTYGSQVTATTNGSSVTFDRTAPSVVSINRQVPLTAITNGITVVYRVTFNEKVSGATTNSFAFMLVSGTVTGTVSNVTAVGTTGTTYDVTIASISGNGDIRLI